MEIDIEKKAKEILETAKDFMAKMKEVVSSSKGFLGVVIGLFKVIPQVVKLVELIGGKESFTGKQKKDLSVVLINELINIPILTESMEGKIIDAGVDVCVDTFNKLLGKKWITIMCMTGEQKNEQVGEPDKTEEPKEESKPSQETPKTDA